MVANAGRDRIDDRVRSIGQPPGLRTLPLPRFALDMLTARRAVPYYGEQAMIFPSTAGTWRDPNNFGKQWRAVRDDLGVREATTQLPQNGGRPDRRRGAIGPCRR